jgi:hypothetical protein
MTQLFKIGASGSKGSNMFLNVGLVMGIALALSCGSAVYAFMIDSVDSSTGGNAMTSDGEVVMLNTATGKIVDFGITVPNSDIKNAKLDLNGDVVTYYSNGAFHTYDISGQEVKDRYTPSDYNPMTDTFTSNGHQLAVYSSGSNSVTVRDTVVSGKASGHSMKVVPGPSTISASALMASDGNDFYWVANTLGDSVLYKYDQSSNKAAVVKSLGFPVTDMAAGSGHVAYSFTSRNVPQVMIMDTSTGNSRHLCQYCSLPRMDGSIVAALGQGTIMVQNVSSGEHQDIQENKDVQDVQVDDGKVGYSWVEQVDPITVKDLRTGKSMTYQPDHMVYNFAMSGDRILMVRSKALLPSNPFSDVRVSFSGSLAGMFLFGTVFMFGMNIMLGRQRTQEAKDANMKAWAAYYQKAQAEGIQLYYQYPSTPGYYQY